MLVGLEYVQETIEYRHQDIANNKTETNSLLMDDVLLALGYNRRREKGIKAFYDKRINWEIAIGDECRFLVYVIGFGDTFPSREDLENQLRVLGLKGYRFLIITDGKRMTIHNESAELIHIASIFDDEADEILELLSNSNWDPDKLDDIPNGNITITNEDVILALRSNDVTNSILTQLGIDITDRSIDILNKLLGEILDSNGDTEVLEYKAKVLELENRIKELSDNSAELLGKVDEYENGKIELLSKIEDLEAKNSELLELEGSSKELSDNHDLLSKIAELEDNIIEYENGKLELISRIAEYESKNSELVTSIAKFSGKNSELLDKIADLESQVEELNKNKDSEVDFSSDSDEIITDLRSQIANLEDELRQYQIGADTRSAYNSEANSIELENKSRELDDALNMVNALEGKVKQLEDKLANLGNVNKETVGYTEAAYRDRISELIYDNQELGEKLKAATMELDDIARKKAGEEDPKIVLARQLLDAVDDNQELNRTYVGVVNSKLFQLNDLSKFTGICIQELYSLVSFDLMKLLFDGDVFKVIQPAVRGDLMINTKKYDIDLSMLSEEEVISRLKTLFSKFDDRVIFMCKTIGTYDENYDANDMSDVNNLIFNEDGSVEMAELDIFGERMDFVKKLDHKEEEQKEELEPVTPLLGLALCDVSDVMWQENSPIRNIRAIGNQSAIYGIKNNKNPYDILLHSVKSLIALTDNISNSVSILNTVNLAEHSGFVSLEQQSESALKIPYTEYYIELNSLQRCISILLTIAEVLSLDESAVYMYFEASYLPGSDLVDNYMDRNLLGLDVCIDKSKLGKAKCGIHCMLTGQVYYNQMCNDDVSKGIDLLVTKSIALRTKHFQTAISDVDKLNNVFSNMFNSVEEDIADSIVDQLNIEFGTEENELLLCNKTNNTWLEISVHGKVYYIDKIPGAIVTKLIFRVHELVYGADAPIDIRAELDSQIYGHFIDGAITADCSEYMSGKWFIELLDGKIKTIS